MAEPNEELAAEWEREKRKHRLTLRKLLGSHAAPFFITWIVAFLVGAAVLFFVVHLELGLAILLGLCIGLFGALRLVLKIRN